jgi:integrase/recombinase XerD
MERLPLKSTSFRYAVQSFKEWLDITGFAYHTVKGWPRSIREMFSYLESKGITHIKQLDSNDIRAYYEKHLRQRPNTSREGGLSNGTLNDHISAIKKFIVYLRQVGKINLPDPKLKFENANKRIVFLSEEEIQELIIATYKEPEYRKKKRDWMLARWWPHLAARDRAMLAVYYGCGLRRNEGKNLNVEDINFDRAILHVRKGKGNKERFVPISKTSLKYLQEYIYDHRAELLEGIKTEALFVSYMSKRLDGQTLHKRLHELQQRTGNAELQEKEIGLHTLRHTIATHLLKAGMSMENISRFLGHSSLESTQVYTHLTGVPQQKKQAFRSIPRFETELLFEDER